jgi:GNAT superfamily N-acetyltransferase
MTRGDIDGAMTVIEAANAAEEGSNRRRTLPSPAQLASRYRAHVRFVERDPSGAWAAVSDDDQVLGVGESIRRGDFWGLSMLFVRPESQSRGVGRQLLDAALGYATGARARMIQSSTDPRAMRRYALAGFAMHPAAYASGTPDRRAIPIGLAGWDGDEDDLELVEEVEVHLGRSRTEDVAFGLEEDRIRLEVVDQGVGRRGWALWHPGRLLMLGATDEDTAGTLLWRYLAGEEGDAVVDGLTSNQDWAFSVAHAARLTLRVGGAMFVDGMTVPGPWIPSGWYF